MKIKNLEQSNTIYSKANEYLKQINNNHVKSKRCSTEMNRKTIFKKQKTDNNFNINTNSSEESEAEEDNNLQSLRIKKFTNSKLNNNFGQCPYCPKKGFSQVSNHIGHMHKCKSCKNLIFECKCIRSETVKEIARNQNKM